MGYDMNIAVLKKKTLELAQEVIPDYSFKDMFSSFLFTRLQPEEYEIPEDEEGRWIAYADRNIFREFFEPKLENGATFIIDRETYYKMMNWLEQKLKSKTLYDYVWNIIEVDFAEIAAMMYVYHGMVNEDIDFETEFVVYSHDW